MKAIVGLGNPGFRYRSTRHNAGFMAAEMLARRSGIRLRERLFSSLCGKGNVGGERVLVAEPLTYMNRSGKAVRVIVEKNLMDLRDLLVISDDKDIELGRIKLKAKGSAGSHNGLISIIKELGTEEFSRLKIGIGAQLDGILLRDHVLASFKRSERKLLDRVLEQACLCAEAWIREGPEAAMNRFNSVSAI